MLDSDWQIHSSCRIIKVMTRVQTSSDFVCHRCMIIQCWTVYHRLNHTIVSKDFGQTETVVSEDAEKICIYLFFIPVS